CPAAQGGHPHPAHHPGGRCLGGHRIARRRPVRRPPLPRLDRGPGGSRAACGNAHRTEPRRHLQGAARRGPHPGRRAHRRRPGPDAGSGRPRGGERRRPLRRPGGLGSARRPCWSGLRCAAPAAHPGLAGGGRAGGPHPDACRRLAELIRPPGPTACGRMTTPPGPLHRAEENPAMATSTEPGTTSTQLADSHDTIRVVGARENNLDGVSVEIPKRRITVFTVVSGSGKSSLVFDTIAAESQRMINETYSAFVQGFMPSLPRPDVDLLDGLTTAIIVDQERMGTNPRSTVGTATDTYTMLRVLYSRIGQPHVGPPTAFAFN